jgi:hypothetical protein
VVSLLTEDLQGGVEDPLLGSPSPGADLGVVGERRAPNDRWNTLGGLITDVGGRRRLGPRPAVAVG